MTTTTVPFPTTCSHCSERMRAGVAHVVDGDRRLHVRCSDAVAGGPRPVARVEVAPAPVAPRRAARRSRRPSKCVTGGNCSSFGSGRSCGAPDCDGH